MGGITPYGNATLVADYLSVLQEEGTESVLLVSHLPLVGSIVSELYGKRNQLVFTLQRLFKLSGVVKRHH